MYVLYIILCNQNTSCETCLCVCPHVQNYLVDPLDSDNVVHAATESTSFEGAYQIGLHLRMEA